MTPLIGLMTPVKIGLAQWMNGYYGEFVPDTPSGQEWARRGLATSVVWAPGRMVDQAEEMLESWRINKNANRASSNAFVPVVIVGMSNDYTESPAESGRPMVDKLPFSFPGDERSFRVRLLQSDIRAQVVIVANEPVTATSIAAQLSLWSNAVHSFSARYSFAGQDMDMPVQVLLQDRIGVPTPVGERVTILAIDFVLRASMPIFYGSPNDAEDTTGYPVLTTFGTDYTPVTPLPPGVTPEQWAAISTIAGNGPQDQARQNDVSGVVLLDLSEKARY